MPFQAHDAKEDEDKGTKELSEEEVQTRIQQYNSQVSENGMKLVSLKAFLEVLHKVTNGAQYLKIFPHLALGFRWDLHWLHQGQPAPQSARHSL